LAAVVLGPLALLSLPSAPAHAQGSPPPSGKEMAEKLAWLGQQLNLTEAQKTKIRPFLKTMASQVTAIKGNPNLSPEQKKAQSIVAGQAAMSNIRTVLTPAQKTKLDAIKAEAMTKMLHQKSAAQGPPK
jgi:Spy/CpxP family protein refolding chaperone